LAGYKTAAGAGCTDQAGCLTSACHICYYTAANYATFDPGTNNFFNHGADTALIVEGNLNLQGHYGNGSVSISPPLTAWKEYGSASAVKPGVGSLPHLRPWRPSHIRRRGDRQLCPL